MTIGALVIHISVLTAADLTHSALFQVNSLWGETAYEIAPEEGISRLSWPMDMRLLGAVYTACFRNMIEAEFSMQASPWSESPRVMEDWDWINESGGPGWIPYDELDIYSRSMLDSKALLLGSDVRIFLFSLPFASLGALGGARYQEADFRAYNTTQTGFGSWRNYTGTVLGPTTTYTVEYRFVHIGTTFKLHADRRLRFTVDTSFIPYSRAKDEDNHIRRLRISRSEATGTGSMFSLSMQYFFTDTWYASTTCSKLRIKTSGDQMQYWYGNDPATPSFDDTGQILTGIDVDIEQETFHVGIGLGCRF